MSTKSSLAYSDPVHLYQECFDQNHVYLELEGTELEYEVSRDRVMVRIPVGIWEAIRQVSTTRFELAPLTDAELETMVRAEVQERVDTLAKWKQQHPDKEPGIVDFAGCLVYGRASEPFEQQVENALSYYRQRQEHERTQLRLKESVKIVQRGDC